MANISNTSTILTYSTRLQALKDLISSDSFSTSLETFRTNTNEAITRLNSLSQGTGDLTLSNGNIVLQSTGRIQGIDTVTDATDAASKSYVDGQGGGGGSLDFIGDTGGTRNVNLSSNTFSILGGTNVSTTGTPSTLTIDVDQGPASGLDADTLDGREATGFIYNTTDHGAATYITVNDADFAIRDTTDTPQNFIWRDHANKLLYLGTLDAEIRTRSSIYPNIDGSYTLGANALRWNRLYVDDITITNNTLVTNLNADLLDNQQGSFYLNTGTSFGGDLSGTYNSISVNSSNSFYISSATTTNPAPLYIKQGTAISNTVLIEGTDSGVTLGPVIDLYRISSSPSIADELGAIQFSGSNDLGDKIPYAQIAGRIQNPVNATQEDGSINFKMYQAGGGPATEVTFRHNGNFFLQDTLVGLNSPVTAAPLHLYDTVASSSGIIYMHLVESGATAGPTMVMLRDSSSPAASDNIGKIEFRGENSTSTVTEYASIRSVIDDPANTLEDGGLLFDTIRGGTLATRVTIGTGVQVGSPTGGDKGAGTINVAGDIYKNDTAYTNPDYALEHYYTGKIEKFKDNPGADTYPGLMKLEELSNFMKENYHLPRVQREDGAGIFERSDFVLEKLEEIFVYLVEMNTRIKELEK